MRGFAATVAAEKFSEEGVQFGLYIRRCTFLEEGFRLLQLLGCGQEIRVRPEAVAPFHAEPVKSHAPEGGCLADLARLELQAHERGGAAAVYEIGVAYAREQVRGLIEGGAPGVHLYTLNRADMCLAVMDGLL